MSDPEYPVTLRVSVLGLARVALLKYSLNLLGKLARLLASSDPEWPQWRRGYCAGQELLIDSSVSWPAPLPGLHFGPLFLASVAHVRHGMTALEVGAGAGVWSLCCVERGAQVSATDLPEVDLSGLVEGARRRGAEIEVKHGDLFSSYLNRRFDHVFFNPPFHVGTPKTPAERAYLGGASGEVTRRYLAQVSEHLNPEGTAWVILPRHERELYREELESLMVTQVAMIWLPLLGRVTLLALKPKHVMG